MMTTEHILLPTALEPFAGEDSSDSDSDISPLFKPNTRPNAQDGQQRPQRPQEQRPQDQRPQEQRPQDQRPQDQRQQDQRPQDQRPGQQQQPRPQGPPQQQQRPPQPQQQPQRPPFAAAPQAQAQSQPAPQAQAQAQAQQAQAEQWRRDAEIRRREAEERSKAIAMAQQAQAKPFNFVTPVKVNNTFPTKGRAIMANVFDSLADYFRKNTLLAVALSCAVLAMLMMVIVASINLANARLPTYVFEGFDSQKKGVIIYLYKATCPFCVKFSDETKPRFIEKVVAAGYEFKELDIGEAVMQDDPEDAIVNYIKSGNVKTVPHIVAYTSNVFKQYGGDRSIADLSSWLGQL